MAASMVVSVLCPNARREKIKVTPNTSILYILEEACKKQSLNPDDYDLKHGKKVLDMSLTIRFANIPNNACLEMCLSVRKQRSASQVTVGLQLEDGRRLLYDFNCLTSLGDIVNYWKGKSGEEGLKGQTQDGEPVCIYMRNEVIGEKALSETTLKSLGLIGGKAMIRLMYRPIEVMGKQAFVEALRPAPKKESIEWGANQSSDNSSWGKTEAITSDSNQSTTPDYDWGDKSKTENVEQDSTLDNRANSKPPTVKNWVSGPNNREEMPFEEAGNTTAEQCYDENEDIEMAEDSDQDEKIFYLGERDAVLFSLNSVPKMIRAELPDDFYEVTIDDLKIQLNEMRQKREVMENRPLELASHRQEKKMEQLQMYQQTVLRIHFPDRLVLQAKFTPLESVSAVKSFVKKFLHEPDDSFYLYTAPPKVILDSDASLISAGLVPAANIYFGTEVIRNVYLKPDVLQQVSTMGAASQAAATLRKKSGEQIAKTNAKPEQTPQITLLPANVHDIPSTSREIERPSTATRNEGKPVPKWFKLGPK